MALKITFSQLAKLAPSARSSYRDAFPTALSILDRYEITANPLRFAHFMAQILHESNGLTIQFENLNYSPERLSKVWPARFMPRGPVDPSEYAHNPEKLANLVYGNRMGNNDPGDGFKYRGRGLLQLTGKDSYRQVTELVRRYNSRAPDYVADPDQVISASWCVEVASAVWRFKGCNELADQDQLRSVTRMINGGLTGLADREEWLKRTKNIWL
jgi:putative chitinase